MRGKGYKDAKVKGPYRIEEVDDYLILWNPEKPCVVLQIDNLTKVAVLTKLTFDKRCTIDGNMARGDGTKKMLETMFEFAKKRGVTSIELSDKSTIVCENGDEIELGAYSFIKYGKTWYEKTFGFQPKEKYQAKYEEAKKRRLEMMDIVVVRSLPCSYFVNETENIDTIMEKLYKKFHEIVWEKKL